MVKNYKYLPILFRECYVWRGTLGKDALKNWQKNQSLKGGEILLIPYHFLILSQGRMAFTSRFRVLGFYGSISKKFQKVRSSVEELLSEHPGGIYVSLSKQLPSRYLKFLMGR